ncbi:hypothetical protein E2P81_ATG06208 [Venturia nashicola]|uniref:Uncharacterized protein n=1 Tax=Venturia nashicola TaxID=86259 RepID=A0A4Z1P2V3_9PEZI|nr:hypothetical protein E6O75_ATG06351 [Venturia nashicola]TLD27862.1 hypothetical protein E2P81_ATG06208 [Venturia nashicola]
MKFTTVFLALFLAAGTIAEDTAPTKVERSLPPTKVNRNLKPKRSGRPEATVWSNLIAILRFFGRVITAEENYRDQVTAIRIAMFISQNSLGTGCARGVEFDDWALIRVMKEIDSM